MATGSTWAAFIAARIREEKVSPLASAARLILNRYSALPQGSALAREYEDFVLPDLALAWNRHPDYAVIVSAAAQPQRMGAS